MNIQKSLQHLQNSVASFSAVSADEADSNDLQAFGML